MADLGVPKILIADDDPHIRQVLVFALTKAGMTTVESADGEETLAVARDQSPDLVVLDINMPKIQGLEVCSRLRVTSDVPILFLSSRDEEIDRVLGIEIGADDYVVKPFSPREVVARVGAILKRSRGRARQSAPEPATIARERLRLDRDGYRAFWDEVEVPLTATEFHLLATLAAAPNKAFSRDEMIDRMHGPGFAVTDRTIDRHVRNVRHKFLKGGGSDVIETRAGVGYRLGPCRGDA
ncbi:response regulator transcription factor [Methylopila sp. 73B]|uniref:response regulator transcription factor n=1 Tax=Methylopila sp. 73B TaxID=1120792 RepID=UPI00036042D9|nr:response regulator transcription factor [Methylopila sp. 73B]